MTYLSRPYTAIDQPRMAALANRYPAAHLHTHDLPYRFSSWALDDLDNARLWFDAQGDLQAWAVLQAPFWAIDLVCAPTPLPHLLPEMLAWAEQRARALTGTPYARPCWFAQVFAGQDEHIRLLEAAGFESQADKGPDSWSKVFLQRPRQLPLEPLSPLPPGFRIRPLAGAQEVPAYVELHQAVFESKNMTVEWRRRTLQQADYTPELDLVIEAPDGRLAAFCIAWLNRHAPRPLGQIEPLGCRAEYRRQGLSRRLLAEALRRLHALGVEDVYVETDNDRDSAMQLYESSGFRLLREVLIFRKDL